MHVLILRKFNIKHRKYLFCLKYFNSGHLLKSIEMSRNRQDHPFEVNHHESQWTGDRCVDHLLIDDKVFPRNISSRPSQDS